MNAYVTEFSVPESFSPVHRAEQYIRNTRFDRPTLVVDLEQVAAQYDALKAGLGRAAMHYAVKANPAPEIIAKLAEMGSNFDAASRAEIELCLSQGAPAERISFGNTIKRVSDIAFAYQVGVRLFAVDAEEEMDKIAENAPGADVFVRVIVENCDADWPLTRKFGCARDKVLHLLELAGSLGLNAKGLSFHVGSQTRQAAMWENTLDQVAAIWQDAKEAGFDLSLLNIGGGFPAFYGDEIQGPTDYARAVMAQVQARFGDVPELIAEPGRGLVAEAGMIAAEVVLVSRKSENDLSRWVYLDIGKFSGLAETMDECIRYQFLTDRDYEDTGPCILAGPSCDSADVLYEKRPVHLPLGLKSGDRIIIPSCGAYTSTYASVGFNGFPPLDVVVLP
ncbi:type III PLP-dependent enzyme [Halocynthiibacter sp. C4]|uniref:type III PLP-dependent enzyme n=1 Tax=Halocynthiibacter sp. C4 TaxID=2992758 RepID=UPI00237B5DE8|nr:type III PLP-dependent enzyme [Halocynthiibacter sp. C4]MDE0590375.1 type III PLP-dependent enzyme [Halocynthiibacter sp. C4]